MSRRPCRTICAGISMSDWTNVLKLMRRMRVRWARCLSRQRGVMGMRSANYAFNVHASEAMTM
jgi:hypothetical protein